MSEQQLIEASPCKLRNGNWGCKTTVPVTVGDTVQIVTRANKQWRAVIAQIVWTDDQTCICETESQNQNQSSKKPSASQVKPAGQTAMKQSSGKASEPSVSHDHLPAPPRTEVTPTEELDAMADAAAEQDAEFDDVMSAMTEFEQDGRS